MIIIVFIVLSRVIIVVTAQEYSHDFGSSTSTSSSDSRSSSSSNSKSSRNSNGSSNDSIKATV